MGKLYRSTNQRIKDTEHAARAALSLGGHAAGNLAPGEL